MIRLAIALCLLLAALQAAQAAGKRVALVVGAGAYVAVPALPNPPRDAKAVGAALERLGFETTVVQDPDRAGFEAAIRALGQRAQDAEAVLFFYAGHALEAGGRNLLVPVSAKIATARDLPFETVDLDLLMSQLDGRARTLLIFLDSCRDNPFLRTLGTAGRGVAGRGGLVAPASDVTGTLIAFATAPGRTAADGTGVDSPFTTALLRHIETPGLEVRQMLAVVRKEVREESGGQQIPWESSALEDEFYFKPQSAATTGGRTAAAPPAAGPVTEGRCRVPRLTGRMREGGATGTMQVVSDGRGCGFSVWRRLSSREPYEGLRVTGAPKNGTVRIEENHRIVYTPKDGFAGAETFTVSSTPRGTVVMQVTVVPPKS